MRLEVGKVHIRDVRFGDATEVTDGTLIIDRDELCRHTQGEDSRILGVQVELAYPGESARIMPVKDVIEPRVKVNGSGGVFPGFVSGVQTVGTGRTLALAGCAVVTVSRIIAFQEGIIDMDGPGAEISSFSKLHNIVLLFDLKEDIAPHEKEAAVRLAGLRAAAYLGEAAREVPPDEVTTYEAPSLLEALTAFPELPKVVYVYMLQSQGLLHDTFVYGVDAKTILPSLISPTEVLDGAIVSGNCVSACDKNTTYHHVNNPVIEELYARHGKELNFIGVVITNENVTLADKERSSDYTAKLVEMLGADGALIAEEGFGNPDTDLMMNCNKIEQRGIKTVLMTDEFAGRDGASQSLVDASKLADAVISTGNANATITLPPMKRLIGYPDSADVLAGGFAGSLGDDGSITVELQAIVGATNILGFERLSATGM
ncbi:MAG: glycine/sarcosine/betaine reductase component B subunit [Candidatus Tectimicrobiota bacterium]